MVGVQAFSKFSLNCITCAIRTTLFFKVIYLEHPFSPQTRAETRGQGVGGSDEVSAGPEGLVGKLLLLVTWSSSPPPPAGSPMGLRSSHRQFCNWMRWISTMILSMSSSAVSLSLLISSPASVWYGCCLFPGLSHPKYVLWIGPGPRATGGRGPQEQASA